MRTTERGKSAAKRLRGEMTPPEVQLWLRLRGVGDGLPRFRRQHALGPYVLDFYCPAARMAMEVDGWGHNMGDQPERDEARDAWLAARGIVVQRIPASDVLADPDEVADGLIRQAVAAATPPPSASPPPPPLRRGGE
ncbi:endonuclease domain-containing protein [Caulobacter sp. S45]|uniref:endonuclease domain-containing protein n=1 Tax=Caulobacter sp. S45 TaxID=1641861 RepID=UPI001576386B|nr:endonuclease domain-containing protein [Caulobacter sp. S45]